MKSVRYGVFIALVVVASLAELAIAQNPAKPDWREGFRTHDENGDGKIDRGEFQNWMVDVFFTETRTTKGTWSSRISKTQ
jgi:Ca2+-binding EF-hand superfamily protein